METNVVGSFVAISTTANAKIVTDHSVLETVATVRSAHVTLAKRLSVKIAEMNVLIVRKYIAETKSAHVSLSKYAKFVERRVVSPAWRTARRTRRYRRARSAVLLIVIFVKWTMVTNMN